MTENLVRNFTSDDLLECYRKGIFPMSEGADDPSIFFVDPEYRGILPLDGLHISRSMQKFMRRTGFTVSLNTCFVHVMEACARPRQNDSETWINFPIKFLYANLHKDGHAHSVEVWDGEELVGGLYGVSLGAAFFGESMFSTRTNASKLALIHLVNRLNTGGYALLDTQFLTEHLASLGAIEITRDEYHAKLEKALAGNGVFMPNKAAN